MSDRFARLMELADGTRKRQEVADLMGVSKSRLGTLTWEARRVGLAPKFHPTVDLWLKVVDFCAAGDKTAEQVAEAFGLNRTQVRHMISNIRYRRGVQVRLADARRDLRTNMVGDLPPEIVKWLIEQVPAACTIDDVIRAIVVDAYHDEVGK